MTVGGDWVLVAPREVHDLVLRCARVAGLDAGAADRVGRNVTAAEVQLGGAVEAFAAVLDDPHRILAEYGDGPDAMVSAEVAARAAGSGTATFGVPTPMAALASVIDDIGDRGLGVDFEGVENDSFTISSLLQWLRKHHMPVNYFPVRRQQAF